MINLIVYLMDLPHLVFFATVEMSYMIYCPGRCCSRDSTISMNFLHFFISDYTAEMISWNFLQFFYLGLHILDFFL